MEKGKMIATRDGFGDEIVEVGKENKNIYVVDVDIGKSCKTAKFMKALPEQYVNVGIAEQNGAALSAGLASTGKIPFVVTYAVFGSLRMCEMIRQEMCYTNLNVKIACSTRACLKRRRRPERSRRDWRRRPPRFSSTIC